MTDDPRKPIELSYHTPVVDPGAPWGNMPTIAQIAIGLTAYVVTAGAGLFCLKRDWSIPLVAVLVIFPSLALWIHVKLRWTSTVFGIMLGLVLSFLWVGARLFI